MNSASRFIMITLVGWVGLRAFSLGMIPGAEALAFDRLPTAPAQTPDSAPLPPVLTTEFAPLEPVASPAPNAADPPPYGSYPQPYAVPYPVPVYAAGMSRAPAVVRYAASPALPRQWGPDEVQGFDLAPAAARYAEAMPLDQWPIAAIASGRSSPTSHVARSTPAEVIRSIPGIDRLSMSGWAMMRRDPGSPSLAANGQLGGSQAGARILWRFQRDLALSLRSSAPVGGVRRTAEFAAGLRWQPLRQIPIALTAERRQSFGPDKGPSAFALFAEGGVYEWPIVAGFNLDAYLQAGVVGLRGRAGFIDGSAT
jgi:hypothetical protein